MDDTLPKINQHTMSNVIKTISTKMYHCKKVINGKYNINDKENYHQHCYRDFILENAMFV